MIFLIYVVLLFLIFLGILDIEIISSSVDIYLQITSIILVILTISFLIIKKFDFFVNFSTLWFGLQRFIGLIICNFKFISVSVFKKFFLVKEVIFLYAFVLLLVHFIVRKLKKISFPLIFADKILIVYCLLLLLYTLFSSVNIWLKLLSLRRFITLPLLYFVGRIAIINFKEIKNCIKYTILFAYSICIYGLIDYFWARTYIYEYLFNIEEYFSKQVLVGFIPINWTFGDIMKSGVFTDYTFGTLPRFVTTFIEPTTLGSFLAFVFLFSVFCKKLINIKPLWIKYLLNLMLLFCLILTFSKGALTILLIGSAFILNYNKKIPKIIRKTYLYSVFVIIIGGIFIILTLNIGASAHINGLKTGILSAIKCPLGLGLGNAGNFANLVGNNVEDTVGGESAIGSMLGQLGFCGFIPYLLFIINLIISLVKKVNSNDKMIFITMAGAFLGYSINSLFTDSALGTTGNYYYFLFSGMLISQVILFNKKEALLNGRKHDEKEDAIYNTENFNSCK